LRRLRIAAPAQLQLAFFDHAREPVERWWSLPKDTQETVVRLLARMIASGVVDSDEKEAGDDAND
jgi:hypothetical protein